MYYQINSDIRSFGAWSGGNSWKQVVLNSSEDVIDYVNSLLDELFTDDSHATETDVNDFLWFELADHMDENGYTYDHISDSFIDTKED